MPVAHSTQVAPASAQGGTAIRVGIGGWTYAPWRDNFYPAGLVHKAELDYASHRLRAIEVNGTYYAAQKPATYAHWVEQTPDGFMFSLKAPRYVVSRRQLAGGGKGIHGFIDGGLAELGNRLGPIVWQFLPTRAFDRDDIAGFLDLLPDALNGLPLRHVLEVRHPSFLDTRYVELARAHGVATVYTDSAEFPHLADISANFVYVRLKASVDAEPCGYAPAELERWAGHARTWAAGGDVVALPHVAAPLPAAPRRDVFIYFIGAAKHRNPAAAMALQSRLP